MSNFNNRKKYFLNELENLSKFRNTKSSFLIWAKVYYEIFYRLPTKKDLLAFDFAFISNGIEGLVKHIEKLFSQNFSIKGQIEYRVFPKDSIFIDITHTINYPFNTGIQRVVRSLIKEIHQNQQVYPVRFESLINSWVVVNQDELDSLISFERNTGQKIPSSESNSIQKRIDDLNEITRAIWHGLYSSYRYLTSNENGIIHRRNINVERYKFILNRFRFKSVYRVRSREDLVVPFFLNQQLVIVEPIQNPHIVDSLEFFEEIGSLSCIVYDLLPISNPEFFQASGSFPQFLRLIGFASKISSISNFTKNQIEKYATLRDDCSLSIHLLPMGENVLINRSSKDLPVILNVGSFEPRKNQMSLLRACELLWSKGSRFQLILVGGQGWNNEDLKSYISELIMNGRDLRFLTDVSNETLEEFYKDSSIVVSIPWVEGFGLPVAEGIARNKIIVASKIPSHIEFANLSNVYFVEPGDLESIVDTLSLCLVNNYEIRDLSPHDFVTWKGYAAEIYNFLAD